MPLFPLRALALSVLSLCSCAARAEPSPQTLVLVRHGHYERVEGGDERAGMGLSPLGVAQARLAGARLSASQAFDARIVSPLRRARDTAAVIGESLGAAAFGVDEDLAECTPTTRRSEVIAEAPPESLAACEAQLERAFARYFRPVEGAPGRTLLVCHGNVIRYLVTRALGVDAKAWLEMSVRHASLTEIRIEADGRFKVITVGDSGHLPEGVQTGATGDLPRSLQVPGPD